MVKGNKSEWEFDEAALSILAMLRDDADMLARCRPSDRLIILLIARNDPGVRRRCA